MHSSASTSCFYKVCRLAVLFFFCKQTGRTGRSKEKLSFAKLALMSCLFPELQPPGLGLGSRWMQRSSSPAYRYTLLTSIQIPAFRCQITCLFLLTSIFLHIVIHCFLVTPSQVHCAMFLWRSFHFFISRIHFSCPIPHPPSHFEMIAQTHLQKNLNSCIVLFALPLFVLNFKNQQLALKLNNQCQQIWFSLQH